MSNSADFSSIDAIINAAYGGISGPAGKPRDWERQRSLFFPGARLIPTAMAAGVNDGRLAPQFLDHDDFVARVEPYFQENGFSAKGIGRRTEEAGHIAPVWSTYESPHHPNDPAPFMRRINSIQLFHDGNRWWIVNTFWQHETATDPIPTK